ncbi:methyltransferase domain-containing protein [Actinotalea sp. M2MS4P-6]|uniref:class I SAM-dependent methyltransferase n=1 Tax=Actinotalea sp. M2MS4P-6 TaxID=2983762 RepID=UPI0021E3E18D|nr:methyltransferase domain-containing protein [Actinotalea sp. M2MS4P-6]MCV2395168.1 methyltransferase domain-containing protein [Actinotalea sp. M2MS4P-6]
MRRTLVIVGCLAAVAGAVAWAARSSRFEQAREAMSRGAAPGRLGSRLNSLGDRPMYRAFADALDAGPGDDVLDVACGWGEFLVNHAADAGHVAGIDLTPEKVALARERLADRLEAGTAEVVVGDAATLPWPDGHFTAVTCMDAIMFFPDQPAALAEFHRVLQPGGRALISFAAEQLPEGVESRTARGVAGTYTAISATAARQMLEQAGFDPVDVTWVPIAGEHQRIGGVLRALGGDQLDVVIGRKPAAA